MAQGKYVRPFNEAEAVFFGIDKYTAQVLSDHPAGLFLGIFLEHGGCGPELHYHQSDQIYFLTRGSVKIRLGDETQHVPTRSLIFIPAGTAHMNWNDGEGQEAHLEMLFPAPHRFKQLAYMVDKPEDVPDEWKTNKKAYVRSLDVAKAVETAPGIKTFPLADPSSGSDRVQIHYSEVQPHQEESTLRVHEYDQYFFVLDGELTVEIALQKHIAKSETLVVVPAGVPYRQHNAGGTVVKHLGLLLPPPGSGKPGDIGVSFALTGEDRAITLPQVAEFDK